MAPLKRERTGINEKLAQNNESLSHENSILKESMRAVVKKLQEKIKEKEAEFNRVVENNKEAKEFLRKVMVISLVWALLESLKRRAVEKRGDQRTRAETH